jgi:galactitol-specific phosphotransferase system IIC component
MKPHEKRRLCAFETGSCAIRRELLLRCPFADLRFGEDLEWSRRMLEQGYAIVFEPASSVEHSHAMYASVPATFDRYFLDAEINRRLFGMWGGKDTLGLAVVFCLKVVRDIREAASCGRGFLYAACWSLYSPFIRSVEALGVVCGANSRLARSPLPGREGA